MTWLLHLLLLSGEHTGLWLSYPVHPKTPFSYHSHSSYQVLLFIAQVDVWHHLYVHCLSPALECKSFFFNFLILYWSIAVLEKELATHSSIHAWKIPWREEPGRLQSMGLQRMDTTEWLSIHTSLLNNTVLISLYSKVIELYISTYIFVFRLFSHLGCY